MSEKPFNKSADQNFSRTEINTRTELSFSEVMGHTREFFSGVKKMGADVSSEAWHALLKDMFTLPHDEMVVVKKYFEQHMEELEKEGSVLLTINPDSVKKHIRGEQLTEIEAYELRTGNSLSFFHIDALNLSDIRALASSKEFEKLTHLAIWHNYLGEQEIKALVTSEFAHNLSHISFHNNILSEDGMRWFAESDRLTKLKSLDIGENDIKKKGIHYLTSSNKSALLNTLELMNCNLNLEKIQILVDSEYVSGLVKLNLSGNTFGPEGAQALATSEHLKNLSEINLEGNNLTLKDIQPLRDKGIKVKI